LFDLAKFALEHGLLEKVPEIIGELAKAEPKHQAVIAFQKVQADLARKTGQDNVTVKQWQERLGNFQTAQSNHYVLLYETKGNGKLAAESADIWLKDLEKNYAGFFYWFALQGKVVPVPTNRLLAVLVSDREAFSHQQKEVFDATDLVSDGFYARRDNVAIFSAKPLEESYVSLVQLTDADGKYKTYSREALLKGQSQKQLTRADVKNGLTSFDIKCRYELYALLFQAKETESELATVSHEATRQLIAAVGLLPRYVEAPEWIDFGMASFFETPKGAYWPGVGGANLPYLVEWKYWQKIKSKKLESNASEALRAVITDKYFREAKSSKKKDSDLMRARTTSWALTYFLAQQKRDGLLRYYEQLANMPRDLEFDDDVLVLTFARAFGLEDVSKPNQVDAAKLAALANKWYGFMKETPLDPPLALNIRMEINKKKTQPATPRQAPNQGNPGGPAS
jgi:hypothetical protein